MASAGRRAAVISRARGAPTAAPRGTERARRAARAGARAPTARGLAVASDARASVRYGVARAGVKRWRVGVAATGWRRPPRVVIKRSLDDV